MKETRKYLKRKQDFLKARQIVTVYSSVSEEAPAPFQRLCYSLGKALSDNNYKISYGSATKGCSKWILDGVEKTHKGNVRAVKYSQWPIDERMYTPPAGMKTEIVETSGEELGDRIKELKRGAMAIVVVAGGPATMEELWNAVTGVAEINAIPVIVLDTDGFFDGTIRQIEKMAKYFYWPKYERYILRASSVEELVHILEGIRYTHTLRKDRTHLRETRRAK